MPNLRDNTMKMQNGFTLIELMIVVVVIGILTSIAIPNYRDYVIRGQLIEGTATLADTRVRIEQYFQDNRTFLNQGLAAFVCPVPSANFNYDCATRTTSSYTIIATGKGSVAGSIYTIDQANTKQTTGFVPGWGTLPVQCWITTKGGTC